MPAAAGPTSCRRKARPGGVPASTSSCDVPPRRRAAPAARPPPRHEGRAPPRVDGRGLPLFEPVLEGGGCLLHGRGGGRHNRVQAEEAVDHPVVAARPRLDTCLLQGIGVGLPPVAGGGGTSGG